MGGEIIALPYRKIQVNEYIRKRITFKIITRIPQ